MIALVADTLAPREDSASKQFQRTYAYDPLAFVHDCITFEEGERLAAYQEEILSELVPRKKMAVRSPHGSGKTACAAWLALWGVLAADDVKVITTASAWRHLQKYLWPEIHKWAARLKWHKIKRPAFGKYELMKQSLRLGPTVEAFAVASNNHVFIEGAHAKRIVYIYDEAKEIPDPTWDASEGAFSTAGEDTGGEAYALAISTPGEPQGRFYQIHTRAAGYEDWWARHITLEEAIKAGRISRIWAEQRERQWGATSALYQNRVLGQFASSNTQTIIPLSWLEAANERWHKWVEDGKPGQLINVGVDVGGGLPNSNKTTIAPIYTNAKVDTLTKIGLQDPDVATMETVAHIAGMIHQGSNVVPVVDVIGIGTGIVHRLRELGYVTIAFHASKGTVLTDISGELGFLNWRAAAWWLMREMLDPNNGFEVALPPDDELIGDLTAPTYRRKAGGKTLGVGALIMVEAKASVARRLKRSTDCADAVLAGLIGPLLAETDPAKQELVTFENLVSLGNW